MFRFLPKTILLGGPREGDFWVVDTAAQPLLTFDVPGGGYVRHVAQRMDAATGTLQARVFYRHADLDAAALVEAERLSWQHGAVIAYGHDSRYLIGIPAAPGAAPVQARPRPPEVEAFMRERNWGVLRAWRVHNHLSQSDLAAYLGIDPAAYALLEAYPSRITVELRGQIAQILGVPTEQLEE